MSSVLYEHPEKPGQSILPWELRVLAVRLSGLGYAGSDVRRGVLGYYELARECRHHLSTLLTQSEGVGEQKQLWEQRLQDLGVRVAGALIEMEDYGSAAAHLETLPITSTTDRSAAFRQALLWLKIGDVDKAREIIAVDNTEEQCESDFVILALADMADGKYDAAAEVWRGLCERVDRERSSPAGEEMWRVNLGICLLYSGQIGEVSFSIVLLLFLLMMRRADAHCPNRD